MKFRQLLFLSGLLILGLQACSLPLGEAAPTATPMAAIASGESGSGNGEQDEAESESVPEQAEEANPAVDVNQPQSACDHPYFPLRTGATWTYRDRSNGSNIRWEVNEVTGDLQSATARMTSFINNPGELSAEGIRIDYTWQCTVGEGTVSFDYGSLSNLNTGLGELSLELVEMQGEGVMFPPADLLAPGYSWTFSGQSKFDFEMQGVGEAQGDLNYEEVYSVLEALPVDVNGVTYDGLLIQRDFQGAITVTVSSLAVGGPQNLDMVTNSVLARGVGFVTMDTQTNVGDAGLELIDFYIP